MAYLAIVGSFSVDAVSRKQTEILKARELKDFYELWPEKFHNMTNGITQRRFMLHANPLLSEFISGRIGREWITDLPKIRKLEDYIDDEDSLREFLRIKYENKLRLVKYIREHNNIDVDPLSIFDVQVKRLHEYKRQMMNALHIMYVYNKLKNDPEFFRNYYPRTYIIGGKAAAGYERAKMTIKLINSVADVINNDASIHGKLKVVFIEDYRVSNAEIIFAAAEVSEQISTASREASGTSNMKFMLNGAVTLGTMDGANVEIVEEVGEENAFVFGMSSEEVMEHERLNDYNPMDIFSSNDELRDVLMQLINGTYSPDDPELFRGIYNSLLTNFSGKPDTYFVLKDFMSYHEASMRTQDAYRDRLGWARMAMLQTCRCGKFSSDRTVSQYIDEIWHLDKLRV